jgi:RNA polymerase sigma factor (sigma-70 family)
MNEKLDRRELNGVDSGHSNASQVLNSEHVLNWIQIAIQQHEGALLRYAYHFVRDVETARDVVQDTFLKLLRQNNPEIETRVAQWLFTVCRNRAIDVGRKEGRMKLGREAVLSGQVDDCPGPVAAAEKAETASDLMKQIEKLPGNQREVLRLKFQAGLSYQEIAEITGLSRTNVGFILHKAIARLRQKMTTQPTRPSEA